MTAECLIPLNAARKYMSAQAQVIRVIVWFIGAGDSYFLFQNLELRCEIREMHTPVAADKATFGKGRMMYGWFAIMFCS